MSVSATTQHPLEPLRRVLRAGLIGVAVLAPVAAIAGWLVDGSAGLVGALVGVLVPAAFFALTVVTALVTLHLSPGALGAIVLGSWVVKLILFIVALSLLNLWDGWSRPVFGVTFMIAVVGWLALEAWMVISTKQPYVQPLPPATRTVHDDSPVRVAEPVGEGGHGVGSVRPSHDSQD
jgi:hypothetical protein